MGIELDKTFNAHEKKSKEQNKRIIGGMFLTHAHDVTKNHRWEELEST